MTPKKKPSAAMVKRVKARWRAEGKTGSKSKSAKARPKPKPVDPITRNVEAATALQFGPVEQQLQGERNVSNQMMANVPSWYQEYQNVLAQATQRTQAATQAAVGAQQTAANTSSALDAQQRAALMQQMQQDAATRGATVDPAVAAQGQQAAASRRQAADAFTGLTGALGAAEVGYRANRQVVGAGQKVTALQSEAQRRRDIEREAADIAQRKGAFKVTERQRQLDKEHTKALENKAFGLDVAKAESDAAAKAATLEDRRRARATSNRNADQSRRVAEAAERRQAEKDAYQRRRGIGPYASSKSRPRTAKEREAASKVRSNVNTAAADARTLRNSRVPVRDAKGDPTGRTRKLKESEIRAAMRDKYKDRDIANAAMDLVILGFISTTNERRLRARGVTIPKDWRRRRPKPTPAIVDVARGRPNIVKRKPK